MRCVRFSSRQGTDPLGGRVGGAVQGSICILRAIENHWCGLTGVGGVGKAYLDLSFKKVALAVLAKQHGVGTTACRLQLPPASPSHGKKAAACPGRAGARTVPCPALTFLAICTPGWPPS